MKFTYKIINCRINSNGVYEWGKGWLSSTQANRYHDWLKNEFPKKGYCFWKHFHNEDGSLSSEHLVSTHGAIYLHPMCIDFTFEDSCNSSGMGKDGKMHYQYPVVAEAIRIYKDLIEYCGGKVNVEGCKLHTFKEGGTVSTTILELDDSGECIGGIDKSFE